MGLSAGAQSGLLDGQRREDAADQARLLGGNTGEKLSKQMVYQQDRHVAFSGVALAQQANPRVALSEQLDQLATKNAGSKSTAAAALVHIDTQDTAAGRTLNLEAASLGDCDVFVAVKSGHDGSMSVRRLFDEFDYPEEFNQTTQPTRKFMAGIGADTLPDGLRQSVQIPLGPDDRAVVFTASDGYWDGYAALQKGHARGLDLDATYHELRDVIGKSVDRGLAGDSKAMADHLVEDLIAQSEQGDIPNTDNISTTAMVIEGQGPKPKPIVIGSIDGSGAVGPTEKLVDDMVADIHANHGPSLLPATPAVAQDTATSKLQSWRQAGGAAAPDPRGDPAPTAPRL